MLLPLCSCDPVISQDGEEVIVTGGSHFAQHGHVLSQSLRAGDDIPEEFLENAKRIGQEAIKAKEIKGNQRNLRF